ncbi:SDR family NAD(P)-dependent oxidoreductase [Candidatus Spongiisocius sp.]|uniref:SDR family NAD(P)-dependent oxidoreductase n=1 Tax=Candidatus Spongiisocius sp. TaxID=3101273 RepID=UPI003B5C5C9A
MANPDRPAAGQPIAIVGMACRFPGADNLESFWQVLAEGRNTVTEGIPGSGGVRLTDLFDDPERRNEACRFGAFVEGIDLFDAAFFRISPVEAELLDPQQRMMLEVSWQALEDAGIDPARLSGTRTGVYTGISNDEYRMMVVDALKPSEAAACLYALSGTNLNGASGRVSYVLGLMGPAKAVDAACASSLVAAHDAVADLQQGKADLAIVGGVQAIINTRIYELRADAMMLSPDGQCKAFDASANGYVRGEGCGVVVLKRLSEAEADGDRIWAVIRGAAVNHGGASTGLTVPHTPALEQVMETALSDAGVRSSEIDYLEAHGTGTSVGDPIEIDAVANVFGPERGPGRPLLIGSVKTNIGHLESAAGIAGLIKAALVVNRGVIPEHLHFRDPHPGVDWDRLPLQVTSSRMDWPSDRPGRRLAGVNSFGISGTNAHIVVEEPRDPDGERGREPQTAGAAQVVPVSLPPPVAGIPLPPEGLGDRRTRLLPVSAKSGNALGELAKRYLSWLDDRTPESGLADMAWTAGIGRSHFDHRAGIAFTDAVSLRARLAALSEDGEGSEPRAATRVAFVYTGQGSQWAGMGRDLYQTEPVARAVLDRCEEVFREARGASLLDVMFGRPSAEGDLGDTAWEQPALYALECALTALWSSAGVRPSVVMGHSVGELAAAQAAGVFSLEDGMRFAAARGSLLSGTAPGAMAAVFAPAERVESVVGRLDGSSSGAGVSVSAYNGAHQVISGPASGIDTLLDRFESEGIRARRLNTTRAFHSALVEPALDQLEAALDGVAIQAPAVPVISNLTGGPVDPGMALDGSYWRRHARQAVAFARGVEALEDLDVDLVVEIGPHAVLGPMVTLAWPDQANGRNASEAPTVLAGMRRPRRDGSSSEPATGFVDAVAEAYAAGLEISFEGLFAGETRRRVSLPGYPFQRERYWLEPSKRRRADDGHPLLGLRYESARGQVTFETEVFPSDPAWLEDHRVFGRLVAPGALYGAMAATASLAEGSDSVVMQDMQLHNPLVFAEPNSANGAGEEGRKMQVVLDDPEQSSSRRVQIYSKGSENEWTLHVEGRVLPGAPPLESGAKIDLEELRARMAPADVPAYYRAKADTGIDLGPSFQTLGRVWSGPGEAVGEVLLPEVLGRNRLDVHPLVLDGCFQVVGIARNMAGGPDEATYLPFGWDGLWLDGRLPDRVFCHVRMGAAPQGAETESGETPEVLSGEMRIYDPNGALIGRLDGYTVKRATKAALLSAFEGVEDLLYEVVWRDRSLESGLKPADFFSTPAAVAAGSGLFPEYLSEAGVDPESRNGLLADLERWSRSYALFNLEKLGWRRTPGEVVDPEELRQRLGVIPEHRRLFRRMLEMLARSGILAEGDDGFTVLLGPDDPLPEDLPPDPEGFADRMAGLYSHGQTEVGLFRRSGSALADVLLGQADPLTLLFSSGEPTAADLYLKAPVARAANALLRDAVRTLLARLPEGRRLRVVEIGAGTGSATASVLPELPAGRFEYAYTDISAGFFAEAEERFGDGDGCIEYRPLDIEKDPVAQGFTSHGYDLIIASNVLHATRYLEETLGHCRTLLAPSGQLVALENLRGLGWMDLTFGQLDGWWRFADEHYRPHHALATPDVWRRALGDAGFEGVEVLGVDDSFSFEMLDKGVIVAQGPEQVEEPPGVWVVTSSGDGLAQELAEELAARNQTVVMAGGRLPDGEEPAAVGTQVIRRALDAESRESWRTLVEGLPRDVPFNGVVHLQGLEGRGAEATTAEMAEDVRQAGSSALALVQGVADSASIPANGLWFVTRGAQVLERERLGELSGSILWGLGKVVALEAPHLQARMIDLDPGLPDRMSDLVDELLYPDHENHIAHRSGRRLAARLVRPDTVAGRLVLPEEPNWVLEPDRDGVFDRPQIKLLPARSLAPREVRVAVEAAGLNFWDVFRSLGFIEEGNLGRELCGYVVDTGSEVSNVAVGDHVVGLGFGAFAPEMVTHEELVAPAPEGVSPSALATVPSAFVSAALSFHLSGLEEGERVLIHAGAGGVGTAAIQLAQAAGAEVFATASLPKHDFVRSLGVEHVYDSRQTAFGDQILEDSGGEGVHVLLNSLTSEGFIEAGLACLAEGGRFVELARRDILTHEEMAAVRPDVAYDILELDVLKKTDPEWVGEVLREVMGQLSAGVLEPLIHSRWPLAEAGPALGFMRAARHLGKIVVTANPLARGRLRQDRTYLVTGGLGGIGCAVAGWLADRGAGTIVLNGRRDPDAEARETIDALRRRGIRVEVELADVTDITALDAMLARMDAELPPLGGVIHSVGVLSDAALTNQTWESFERVLRPKIVGAWHLHRATRGLDLDLFILFSSRVGVMGNPGQANHAAANAFLDQLAGHRRARGLPGQAIAWGAWSEIGEAAEQRERIEQRRAALGGRWFTPQQGIRTLERLVRQDSTNSVVMSMDWSVFEEAVEERPPLLEDMLSSDAGDAADASTVEDIVSRLGATPPADHEEVLGAFLAEQVQAVLRLPKAPSPKVGFFDLGMDSLMAVELRNRLNRAFEGEYVASNTVVFDYPDIESMSRHLAEELGELAVAGEASPSPEIPEPEPPVPVRSGDDGIAVVGMACRFPGASDLAAFWELLESGVDAVTDGRQDAGSWSGAVGDPDAEDIAYRRGAFVDGIDWFDSRFFRISPIEAQLMDPQQRMLLETTWQALEDAGLDPDELRGSRTGVYAGIGTSEYRDLIAAGSRADSYLGTTGSVAVGRIAFALGLEGPAMPVDMACASSLAAVHQAVVGLQRGEVDMALAGGVNVVLSPPISRFMMDVGMLSPTGRCSPFDASADGYVRGEGCGMVVLKRLSDAEVDGDRIWAVIRGSAVNQNGASAGLTVPNGPAQERIMKEALAQAGVAPSRVDYLESHATGSQLGDPIELNAAAAVYGDGRARDRPLLVGSVKSNIGHAEWAAGIAAFIKTVLSMSQGVIPPLLHLRDPNPHVEWDRIPVQLTSERAKWPTDSGRPPLAGVNAFGLSGTNAHVLVEGYGPVADAPAAGNGIRPPEGGPEPVPVSLPEPADRRPASSETFGGRPARLLPLSGKSARAVRDLARSYLAWLDGQEGSASDPALSDLAWTAGTGRSHFPHRAGLVFGDAGQLRQGLRSLAASHEGPDRDVRDGPTRVAFAYTGQFGLRGKPAEGLYRSEPVARAVLDRCEEALREDLDVSLLDTMFGQPGVEHDPALTHPLAYAFACALTAQWASIGIRPSAVVGSGPGLPAAAQAAGALGLEDGLRLATALGVWQRTRSGPDPQAVLKGLEEALAGVTLSEPSVSLVSGASGRVVESIGELEIAYWLRHATEPAGFSGCGRTLDRLGVDVVVEVGLDAMGRRGIGEAWPVAAEAPAVLPALVSPPGDGEPPGLDDGFVRAVAGAYEAGLDVSFAGLFAGEVRRRIALPTYPFQRRRHWI